MAAFDAKFGRVAEEFDRYRPDYPAELFARILAATGGRERALDLGAGTGKSMRALLEHFGAVRGGRDACTVGNIGAKSPRNSNRRTAPGKGSGAAPAGRGSRGPRSAERKRVLGAAERGPRQSMIAVEPDPGMAEFLQRVLPAAEVRNVTAEACRQPEASLDLVTVGNAIHWMEAPEVLARARGWLRPGAVLAVYDRPLPRATAALDAVALAELRGPWKPHRDLRLQRDRHWKETVRAAPGFDLIEEATVPNLVRMSPHDYTGFWRSTSYASAYARTLADPEPYWQALESRLAAAAGGERATVDFSSTLVLLRRPA